MPNISASVFSAHRCKNFSFCLCSIQFLQSVSAILWFNLRINTLEQIKRNKMHKFISPEKGVPTVNATQYCVLNGRIFNFFCKTKSYEAMLTDYNVAFYRSLYHTIYQSIPNHTRREKFDTCLTTSSLHKNFSVFPWPQ